MGILTANNQCQEPSDKIAEANVGPAAIDTATTNALIPIPRPNCCFG